MLSSDGTEDDLEVVELEQASRSIEVSESGSESNPETLEVFVPKAAMIFNHMDQYTDPVLLHIIPVLFWKVVWPYYARNYAGIMYAGLAVGKTLVIPTDMHD